MVIFFFSGCRLFMCYIFVSRFLVWIVLHCLIGPFIADYAVWALLIVEGRMVTYSC